VARALCRDVPSPGEWTSPPTLSGHLYGLLGPWAVQDLAGGGGHEAVGSWRQCRRDAKQALRREARRVVPLALYAEEKLGGSVQSPFAFESHCHEHRSVRSGPQGETSVHFDGLAGRHGLGSRHGESPSPPLDRRSAPRADLEHALVQP